MLRVLLPLRKRLQLPLKINIPCNRSSRTCELMVVGRLSAAPSVLGRRPRSEITLEPVVSYRPYLEKIEEKRNE